ncbi:MULTISPECIES: VOC family protein [Shewanella]|uniref:VOC family protein n=1 Tax=Shewanella TaxID=22 RepID=UPI000491840D|nr:MULTISPECIES: VOC family protein [Shewanella]MBO2614007.1 VOC family protein [Shewanella algae]MBO2618128.1 VOC family protein [Shewanella algae]TVP00859.1 glyoxalase [Shewanella algae]
MIDHLSSYATDYPRTRDFYLETLNALGYPLVMELVAEWNSEFPSQRMCAFGPDNKPVFWIIETKTPHTPRHIAFTAADRNAVSRFYQLALEHGGQCNGLPGLRPHYHAHYFGAFVLDPDGNNVEAVCHQPQ